MAETLLPNTRSARLSAISQIIEQKKIRSQRELADELFELGIDVAQPTLSRDLDDLSVGKDRAGFYVLGEIELADEQRLTRNLRDLMLSIDKSEQLCVLRTPPGGAHLLAGSIDQSRISGLLGTIAGDDTILMIARDSDAAERIVADFLLKAEIGKKEKE